MSELPKHKVKSYLCCSRHILNALTPGSPCIALKQRLVSSTITAAPNCKHQQMSAHNRQTAAGRSSCCGTPNCTPVCMQKPFRPAHHHPKTRTSTLTPRQKRTSIHPPSLPTAHLHSPPPQRHSPALRRCGTFLSRCLPAPPAALAGPAWLAQQQTAAARLLPGSQQPAGCRSSVTTTTSNSSNSRLSSSKSIINKQ